MARVLLILSIILTLICAGLGFVAKKNVDSLSDAVKEKSSQLNVARTTTKKAQDDFAAAKKELDVSKQQLEEKTTEAAAAKTTADEASKKLADANTALEMKTKELAEMIEKFKVEPGTNPTQAIADYEKVKTDLKQAQNELGELKVMNEALTQRAKDKEDALVASENTVKAYKYGITKSGLSGRVLAYNPGWNFVVLSIGDKSGLKAGANMIVQRGNAMIAKVKVSTVEPNTAIADVLPGSMRGGRIEPGDTVIFEGTR
jgi:uncharacterized protein YxeA